MRDGLRWLPASFIRVGTQVVSFNETVDEQATNPEFYRFLGFYLGDGWARYRKGMGGDFNVCAYGEEAKKYGDMGQRLWGLTPHNDDRGVHFYSAKVAKTFVSLGNAHTKRIPRHCFNLPRGDREQLLEGIIDSDGHRNKNGISYIEMCNRDLIADIQRLAEGLGYKVNGIYERTRGDKVICGKEVGKATSYTIAIGYKEKPSYTKEYVTDKEVLPGTQGVWDLQMANNHNFICNNTVVHNSGGAIFLADTGEQVGITARISNIQIGFGMDVITWMGFSVAPQRIYEFLDEQELKFLYDSNDTYKAAMERRKRKQELVLLRITGQEEEDTDD
jgi:hypothetical protein